MLRVWNLSLVIATFCLTILGTFLTRSGVLNSVHTFSTSSIGPWLLTFLGVCARGRRRPDRVARRPAPIARAASIRRCRARPRSCSTTCCSRASRSSCSPARCSRCSSQALQNKQITVGEPYFDKLGVPIGLALLFLMARRARAAVAGRERGDVARTGCWSRRGSAALTLVFALLGGARGIADVIAFGLGAFVLASVGRSVVRGRAGAATRDLGGAAGRGGAHRARRTRGSTAGCSCTSAWSCSRWRLATTSGYTTKREVQLAPGQSTTVRGFTVTYLRTRDDRRRAEDHDRGDRRLRRGSAISATLAPAISSYPNFPDGIGTPAIHSDSVARRVPHARVGAHVGTAGAVTLGVQVGTFVMWLWIGGVIMALGILLALTPTRARCARARSIADVSDAGDDSAPAPLVEAPRPDADSDPLDRARGRGRAGRLRRRARGAAPHRGRRCPRLVQEHKPAPSFDLTTLDGKPISSAQLEGKTYVVNFWNSWCIPCQQEEPALQDLLRRAPRPSPTSRWSASSVDDDASPIRDYVARTRDHVAGRVRSERQRGARLRHDRPTRDVRDLARPASPRAAGSGRSTRGRSRHLAAGRATAGRRLRLKRCVGAVAGARGRRAS